jgi:hypothetical protein
VLVKFSQRYGYTTVPEALKPESMPEVLRVALWNALHRALWGVPGFMWRKANGRMIGVGAIGRFAKDFWTRARVRIDTIPSVPEDILASLQNAFFSGKWFEVYDFLEAVLAISPSPNLEAEISRALEEEKAAYRLVQWRFVQITEPAEVEALTPAMGARDTFAPASEHLKRAVDLYADRAAPDYRNSIKESISAVEAAAKVVSNKPNATLGDALTALERDGKLHKALKTAFSALYGYTSQADGIRHALMDEPNLTAADAKFFMLACASFVNYLKARHTIT